MRPFQFGPRGTPFGQLMWEHLLALRRYGPYLTESEGEATARATALLLAGALSRARTLNLGGARSTREVLLAAIRTYIEQSLAAPGLDTNRLCRRFGVSRATLYRVLEPVGGLGRYLQQRRLCRAFRQLASLEHRHRRIIDFAIDCQFASDTTFTRAFRRQFGITPGAVRTLAEAVRAGAGPPLDPPEVWLDRASQR